MYCPFRFAIRARVYSFQFLMTLIKESKLFETNNLLAFIGATSAQDLVTG